MKRKKALLVNDMLNDFLKPGGALYCGDKARRIIPYVAKKIEEFHRNGDPVIFVCDAHRMSDYEIQCKLWPPHAMKNKPGARLVGGLSRNKKDVVIEKHFYDGFTNPALERKLRQLKIDDVYLTGVCTSICIMETVSALFHRRIPVHIYKKGVADFSPKNHELALKRMKQLFGIHLIN